MITHVKKEQVHIIKNQYILLFIQILELWHNFKQIVKMIRERLFTNKLKDIVQFLQVYNFKHPRNVI